MLKKLFNNFTLAWGNPRWRWALLIAVVSDILGFFVVFLPPVQWSIDIITAILLLFTLGFRWKLFTALAVEVVPGLQVFPAWTLVIVAMSATDTKNKTDK